MNREYYGYRRPKPPTLDEYLSQCHGHSVNLIPPAQNIFFVTEDEPAELQMNLSQTIQLPKSYNQAKTKKKVAHN